MISGEQQTFFLEQKTNVIRSMTGRVDCAQPNGIACLYSTAGSSSAGATIRPSLATAQLDHEIVRGLYGWNAGHVLQTIRGRRQADDRRTRRLRESASATRMIPVSVSDENEPESRNRGTQLRNVRTIVGTWIEHGDGWVSQNVAVRSWSRHERSIGRDKTLHRS
jgi:hypothetical protein